MQASVQALPKTKEAQEKSNITIKEEYPMLTGGVQKQTLKDQKTRMNLKRRKRRKREMRDQDLRVFSWKSETIYRSP